MINKLFDPTVFRKYLKYISNKPKTEEAFIDGSAYYMAGVKYGKHAGAHKQECRKYIKTTLENYKESILNEEKKYDTHIETLAKKNKDELKQFLATAKVEFEQIEVQNSLPLPPTHLPVPPHEGGFTVSVSDLLS